MAAHAATKPAGKPAIRRINTGWGHRYTIDGEPAPGVTTLLGKGMPKPALIAWAGNTVAAYVADADPEELERLRALGRDNMYDFLKKAPNRDRDRGAARGTDVHTYAERLVRGEPVEPPDDIAGYVEAAVAFMNDWRPAPVLVEALVASRQYRYCGTLDLVADLPDGRRAILDYKTGKPLRRPTDKGVYPEAALQLAAYRWCDTYVDADGNELPMSEVGINCSYAVRLYPDGTYRCCPVQTDETVFSYFLNIARVGRFFDRMAEWIGEAESWKAAA